jgi:TatA/E family protein of Tat protein translocase
MIGMFSHWELMIVAFVGVLIFGKRIPKMFKALGETVGEIRKMGK